MAAKRKRLTKALHGLSCMTMALAMACKEVQVSRMQPTSNNRFLKLDFAAGPEDTEFLAAVKFRRSRAELVRSPGFEKEKDLNRAPNITWWWYEVDLVPESVVNGNWSLAEGVQLDCRHYLATEDDKSWVGILVKNKSGAVKWLKDYAIRDGRVIDPMDNRVIGAERDLSGIVLEYRRLNGL